MLYVKIDERDNADEEQSAEAFSILVSGQLSIGRRKLNGTPLPGYSQYQVAVERDVLGEKNIGPKSKNGWGSLGEKYYALDRFVLKNRFGNVGSDVEE